MPTPATSPLGEQADVESRSRSGAFDAMRFRQVLGQYPTGVCVITAIGPDNGPVGMSVGSFTSLSLDPPLVAFMPDKKSTSWPKIRHGKSFCVNVLSAEQEPLCRQFASRGSDKFADIPWRPAGSGSPVIEGVVAWIDCDVERVDDAGDHEIVIGRVRALDVAGASLPLLFFRGGYGRFSPLTMTAGEPDLLTHLGTVDRARPDMEAAARDLGDEVVATSMVDGDVVLLASAAPPGRSRTGSTVVGQRIPAIPPVGCMLMAWQAPHHINAWLSKRRSEDHDDLRRRLARIRERGYSVTLDGPSVTELMKLLDRQAVPTAEQLDPEQRRLLEQMRIDPVEFGPEHTPEVRRIYVPVFGADTAVSLVLGLRLRRGPADGAELERKVERLQHAAEAAMNRIGGRRAK
jgi:flavin reductase (DIM6/NTAB) family NADH-FMN oxidoreductase RutF/DNA-binding IclR family transcriptional regulator